MMQKMIFGTKIWEVLSTKGLVEEQVINGVHIQAATEAGKELGIVSVDRESKAGTHYQVLMYPQEVQKIIVEHYTVKDSD